MDRRTFCTFLAASALPAAGAEPWPNRPLRMIAAGSGSVTDVRARWIAARLSPLLGQPIVVENKPGAGGILAMEAGAQGAADGYTLVLIHQGTVAVNPFIYAKLPYDPFRDFVPVTRLGVGPLALVAGPSVGAATVAELVSLAKSRTKPLTFSSPGIGTPPHLAAELFRREAGIAALHVPYKSGGQAATDLIAGHVDFSIEGMNVTLPHVKAGRLRALATTGATRVPALPDVPTMQEAGVAGYLFHGWVGVAVPAATPRPIVERLHAAFAKVLASDEARDWFGAIGAEPGAQTPEQFAAFMRAEYDKWGKVIREAGIRAE